MELILIDNAMMYTIRDNIEKVYLGEELTAELLMIEIKDAVNKMQSRNAWAARRVGGEE